MTGGSRSDGPNWSQMWLLLQQVAAAQQQTPRPAAAAAAEGAGLAAEDAAAQFDKFIREADGVAVTPPPYPGRQIKLSKLGYGYCHLMQGKPECPGMEPTRLMGF